MSDLYRNPIEGPSRPEEHEAPQNDPGDWPHEFAGPGGRTTNIENDERGILDATIFRTMGRHREAELGSNHDSFGVGVYAEGRERYGD